jgi:NTE family protein
VTRERDTSPARTPRKTFALALGGGGARSLAQIAVFEALDDLGIRPVAIAGTSFGALVGAAYAAGMSGKAIRRIVIDLANDRGAIYARLVSARARSLSELFSAPFGNPLLLDAEKFCAQFLPQDVPNDFAALPVPLTVIAADLYARREAAFDTGALRPAVAASMAIPGLLRPVEISGRILVDGAAVNPLPFESLRGRADFVVAIDSSFGPTEARGVPEPWDCLFATLQVMTNTIIAEKLKHGAPDILLKPNVGTFRLFDFFLASSILRAADPIKAEVKEKLGALLNV